MFQVANMMDPEQKLLPETKLNPLVILYLCKTQHV